MAFTKINAAGIGTTETVTVDGLTVINDGSFGGNLTVGGVLTYEDVTNVDSVGLITARNGIVVGSGITLSKDGDGFFTGIVTATSYYGDGSNLSNITSTTINSNADNRLITGSGTANTLNGESNLTFDGSTLTVTGSIDLSSHLDMGDSDVVKLGDGDDFQLYHDGSNSYITNSTNNLFINGNGTKKSVACIPDGAVELYYDDTKKIETTSIGAQITNGTGNTQLNIRGGSSDGTATIQFISDDAASNSDSWRLQSGNSNDFYIQNYASGSWETSIDATGNGNVRLMYNNSKKLETINTGVTITGTLNADQGLFTDNGSSEPILGVLSDDESPWAFVINNSTNSDNYTNGLKFYVNNSGNVIQQTRGASAYKTHSFTMSNSSSSETVMQFETDRSVTLKHQGSTKLQTTSVGVNITGQSTFVQNAGDANLIVGSTNASGAYLVLDGDSNGDAAGGDYAYLLHDNSGNLQIVSSNPGGNSNIQFHNNGSEKLRINSNGRFDIGDSIGTAHCGKFQVIHEGGGQLANDCLSYFETNSNDWIMIFNSNEGGSASHYHIYFMEEGTVRGQIAGSHGSNVNFTQGSDYRWKENIVDMTGTEGIDICKKLKPRKYNWIKNREGTGQINTVDGFIAHEVVEAGVLGAVTGEKDAVNEDGSIKGQELDYGQITPVLAAAIKGLIDKVETLKSRLDAAGL